MEATLDPQMMRSLSKQREAVVRIAFVLATAARRVHKPDDPVADDGSSNRLWASARQCTMQCINLNRVHMVFQAV